jgi:hypothetical protein
VHLVGFTVEMNFIFLNISKNMHDTRNNSKLFTQSVHIPIGFGGGHYHQLFVL